MGFDSTHDFAPPTVFLELHLGPWMWVISSKSLQTRGAVAPVLCSHAPAPSVLLGLLCPWTWGIFSKSLQHHAAATPAPPWFDKIWIPLLGFLVINLVLSFKPSLLLSPPHPWRRKIPAPIVV